MRRKKSNRVQGFGTGFTFQVLFFFLHSDRERKSREREKGEREREICGSENKSKKEILSHVGFHEKWAVMSE